MGDSLSYLDNLLSNCINLLSQPFFVIQKLLISPVLCMVGTISCYEEKM